MYMNNRYYQWFSNVEPQKITKSLLIAYVVATSLQILYTNMPETVFLSFSIHLFWLFLNLINILYNVFVPFCAIWFSLSMIMYNNPIYSLLGLIFVFFNMIIILISLKIEFLAMIFLIIYIGAISILFLFVIMLFNLKKIYNLKTLRIFHFISTIVALCCFFKFYYIIVDCFQILFNYGFDNQSYQFVYIKSLVGSITYFEDIMAIGAFMYTTTSEIFLAIGYILLIAMIGAIIIALSTIKQTRSVYIK